MKIIMVAVCSINGKSTHSPNPNIYEWTSNEDQEFYFSLLSKSKLIVMGSSTYDAAKHLIKLKKGTLRIVLTAHPKKYESEKIKGQLEFTSATPRQLINRLINYKQMLLVGGSKVYSSFMKAGLVDEIYLTIEPVVFGRGKPLFAEEEFESNLELVSIEKLNRKGTILLKYKVENGKVKI